MTTIILGKNGQLGSALMRMLGDRAVGFSHGDADFTDKDSVHKAFAGLTPAAIINASAYTLVDKAESESEAAFTANATLPRILAEYCRERDIPFIHYSTDYVFSGTGSAPYQETDPSAPLNIYGRSKRAGEEAIEAIGGRYLIFRTSWVYNHTHKNFLTTMLSLGQQREELSIVSDQIGAPTWAEDLAKATLKASCKALAKEHYPSGIYNLCSGGETSWHGFAETIFAQARKHNLPLTLQTLHPIPATAYPTPAKRPYNSRLDCSKAKTVLEVEIAHWETGLAQCMEKLVESSTYTIKRPARC